MNTTFIYTRHTDTQHKQIMDTFLSKMNSLAFNWLYIFFCLKALGKLHFIKILWVKAKRKKISRDVQAPKKMPKCQDTWWMSPEKNIPMNTWSHYLGVSISIYSCPCNECKILQHHLQTLFSMYCICATASSSWLDLILRTGVVFFSFSFENLCKKLLYLFLGHLVSLMLMESSR